MKTAKFGSHSAMWHLICQTAIAVCMQSAWAESTAPAPKVQPTQVVDSLESTFGVHPGERRNHTKGTCAVGEFVGTSAGAALSRSELFSGTTIPVIARFSLAGGNPQVPDVTRNARGMAIEFRLSDGSRQHMTMLNTPVFGAAVPNTFNDAIIAAKPDPKTGNPDPQKIRDFLATHPDALPQANYIDDNNPTRNYYEAAYFGIHTFKFVDAKGSEHPVKWRFVPLDGEKSLTAAEIKSAPHDFLEPNLIRRTMHGPVRWNMVVYVGQPGDPQDNATVTWPETRTHFIAGTLTISEAMPQKGAECEKINYDPLVMADGIAPSNDPILLFRSPAYAISFVRRLSGN